MYLMLNDENQGYLEREVFGWDDEHHDKWEDAYDHYYENIYDKPTPFLEKELLHNRHPNIWGN